MTNQELSINQLHNIYHDMLLIRRFEERAAQLYGRGLIAGFCHLYIGQEAVVVGMQNAQKENDAVITAYRDHGHMLAAGMNPKKVMAELTGRQEGYSKGKGGSMHMFSKKNKILWRTWNSWSSNSFRNRTCICSTIPGRKRLSYNSIYGRWSCKSRS